MSGAYGGWIRTSHPNCNSFCLVIKETCFFLHYPDWRLCIFWWLIQDGFHWGKLSAGLIGVGTCWNQSFGFLEGAHNRGLLSNPTVYTKSPRMKTGLWSGCWWFISLALRSFPFHIIVQYLFFLDQFVLKMELFP